MSTPNTPPNTPNQAGDPFGPDNFGFLNPSGEVQAVEHYARLGTPIEWENNPYTSTNPMIASGGWPSEERRAILRAQVSGGERSYYLRGYELIDIDSSVEKGYLDKVVLDPSQGSFMPDVVIGAPALFSEGNKISSVTIATHTFPSAGDAPGLSLSRAANPFAQFESIVERYKDLPEPTPAERVDQVVVELDGTIKPLEHDNTYRLNRSGWRVDNLDDDARATARSAPELRSRHGARISPGSPLKTEKQRDEMGNEAIDPRTGKAKSKINPRTGQPLYTEGIERKPYEPRVLEGIEVDAKQAHKEIWHESKENLRDGSTPIKRRLINEKDIVKDAIKRRLEERKQRPRSDRKL